MNYQIESERLFLRQFQLNDAVAYHQMTTDKLVQEYVEYACAPTLEETIENILGAEKITALVDLLSEYNSIIKASIASL